LEGSRGKSPSFFLNWQMLRLSSQEGDPAEWIISLILCVVTIGKRKIYSGF
jgi:hypothetical protein